MNGYTSLASDFSVKETIDRLAAVVASKGMTVFSRIDHGINAEQVGLDLRPTELLIFGNPKAGTLLMQDQQTVGIDLPLKALAWQDEAGKIWLTYNNADWLADRHSLTEKSTTVVKTIEESIIQVCTMAAKKEHVI